VTALVIFDCDGVIVDSEPLANAVLHARLVALGLGLTLEESAVRFTGRTMADCVTLIEAELGERVPEDFVASVRRETKAAFDDGLAPVHGIAEVLATLATPFCLASSGSHEKIRHSLRLTGTDRYFDKTRIFSAQDVAVGKPAPDLFLHAAASVGAPPARCVVVEDSVPGVLAGVAAGMRVFGYAARTPSRQLEAAGATVFCSMDRLPTLLETGPR
jgi:HAD superfamily hydrolase (TIGR01509 family)